MQIPVARVRGVRVCAFRTKYPYPKTNSDTAILPPFAEKQVIAFPAGNQSNNNFQYLKMSDAGADYEFVNSPGVENGTTVMVFVYPDAIQLGAGRMTFNGIGVYVNGKNLTTLTGGTLVLTNGANFGGTGKFGTTTISGANLVVTGGSVFNVGGTSGAIALSVSPDADGNGGEITIDGGTVLAGVLDLGNSQTGGRMVLKGARPRLYISPSGYIMSTKGGELAFEIPQGGYGDWVPVITSSSNSKNFTNGKSAPTVKVVAESPVFGSPYDGVVPLITVKTSASYMKSYVSGKLSDCGCASPASCAWRFSTASMASNTAIADAGTISDYAWFEDCKTGSKDPATTFIGVAVHGESPDPVPPALGGSIATEAELDGTSLSATIAVTADVTTLGDGAVGDAIRVSGAMKTPGSVVIEVSKTEDFASVYDSFDVGQIAAEGDFAHTFQTADTAAANYVKPGETYYVRAVATKGDARARPRCTSCGATTASRTTTT